MIFREEWSAERKNALALQGKINLPFAISNVFITFARKIKINSYL